MYTRKVQISARVDMPGDLQMSLLDVARFFDIACATTNYQTTVFIATVSPLF